MLPRLTSVTTSRTHRKGEQEVKFLVLFVGTWGRRMSRFGEDAEFSLSCVGSVVPMQYPHRDSEGLEISSEMPQWTLEWRW